MWEAAVTAVQACIFTLGHLTGSLGHGILLTALALRLALLPLSIRLARRARRTQLRLAKLRPELEQLQARYQGDPGRLSQETLALYRRHGLSPVDGKQLVGGLLQLPPLSAMYAALRTGLGSGAAYGWILDLARPDMGLVALAAGVAGLGVLLGAPMGAAKGPQLVGVLLAVVMTGGFLLHASAAMGLSVAVSAGVNLGQSWWLRREPAAAA